MSGVQLTGTITTKNPLDKYPTHAGITQLGGFRIVDNITERNNIYI